MGDRGGGLLHECSRKYLLLSICTIQFDFQSLWTNFKPSKFRMKTPSERNFEGHKTKTKPKFKKKRFSNLRFRLDDGKFCQVPNWVASIWGIMGTVCCIILVYNIFHYPLLTSSPSSDLSGLIWSLQKSAWKRHLSQIHRSVKRKRNRKSKNGPTSFEYFPILYESLIIFEISHLSREGISFEIFDFRNFDGPVTSTGFIVISKKRSY